MTVAELPPKHPARRYGECRYCGARTPNTWTATCAAHSDLPRLEPEATLARDAGLEELKSSRHRSNNRKDRPDEGPSTSAG